MAAKRILLVFNENGFSDTCLSFILALAKNDNSLLTGIFLQDLSYLLLNTNLGLDPQPFEYSLEVYEDLNREELKEMKQSISSFTLRCREAGVNCQVHMDKGIPVQELIHESNYADLLILNYHTYLSSSQTHGTDALVEDLLASLQCPLLVLPDEPVLPKTIIFADGHGHYTMHAFREFTHLLKEDFKASYKVITNEQDQHTRKLQLEYMLFHYPGLEVENFEISEEEELLSLVEGKQDVMVVLHNRSKGWFGRLFGKSTATGLLHKASVPLFIVH